MRDPETGRRGKIIELVEEKKILKEARTPDMMGDSFMIHQVLQDLMFHLQELGFMPFTREITKPKITLYLTEEEYELLGVRLEVNEIYDVEFKNGSIIFKKAYD